MGRELGSGAIPAGEVHLKIAFLICSFGLYFRCVMPCIVTTCVWPVGDGVREWIYNIEISPVGLLMRTHIRLRPSCLMIYHGQRH